MCSHFLVGTFISRPFKRAVTQICVLSQSGGKELSVSSVVLNKEVQHSPRFIINSTNRHTCPVWLLSLCVSFLVHLHPVIT